jgi:hypothetical protein
MERLILLRCLSNLLHQHCYNPVLLYTSQLHCEKVFLSIDYGTKKKGYLIAITSTINFQK